MLGTTEFSPQVAKPPGDTVVTVKTYTSSDFTSNWHAKARKMASETHMPSSAGECLPLPSTPLALQGGTNKSNTGRVSGTKNPYKTTANFDSGRRGSAL